MCHSVGVDPVVLADVDYARWAIPQALIQLPCIRVVVGHPDRYAPVAALQSPSLGADDQCGPDTFPAVLGSDLKVTDLHSVRMRRSPFGTAIPCPSDHCGTERLALAPRHEVVRCTGLPRG